MKPFVAQNHNLVVEGGIRIASLAGAAAGGAAHALFATTAVFSMMASKMDYNPFTRPTPMSRFASACLTRGLKIETIGDPA